jgi:hypothetical protein
MVLFAEVEPSSLACCPPPKTKRKVVERSSDWVLQMLEEFSHYVGLSCDGFEGRLSSLFSDIIANHEAQGAGSHSKVGKKGVRDINGLFSSINYDARSGSVSRGRNKGRAERGST